MALNRQDVLEKVRGLVAEQLSIDIDRICEDTSFVDDLDADSLDTVTIVMELEDEFDLDIPREDDVRLVSVRLAVDYVLWCSVGKRGQNPLVAPATT